MLFNKSMSLFLNMTQTQQTNKTIQLSEDIRILPSYKSIHPLLGLKVKFEAVKKIWLKRTDHRKILLG